MRHRHVVFPSHGSSEQTGRELELSAAVGSPHVCSVCFNNDSDGTRTRVRSAASFSLMNRAPSASCPSRTP